MEVAIVLACFALIITLYLLWKNYTKPHYRLPPGPKALPIVGHFFENWFNPAYINKVAESHGDIFTLRVLWQNIIVVNSYETVKEAFGNDWLSGRVGSPFSDEFSNGGHGLILSEGPLWRTHRRFTLSVLRDFGFGRSKIENTIHDELQLLRDKVAQLNGRPFYPQPEYAKAVSNVINSIVFNERCSEDPEFECIVELVKAIASAQQKSALVLALWPLLKILPFDVANLKSLDLMTKNLYAYVGKKFQQHKDTFNPANIRDYIDAFLLETDGKGEAQFFTDTQLLQSIFDLFLAGMETTSTTLLWASIFLAKNQQVQRKAFQEIEQTIGHAKLPQSSDRTKLRYVDALMHEVLRYSTLVPLGLPHKATATGQVAGYEIPKDSIVMSNLWNVHRSKKLWKHPDSFDPDNFLDDEGNLINTNYMLAFSTGKRVCLGETLARQELFIFLTGLLQHFEFVEDAAHSLDGIENCGDNSILRAPRRFEVIARRRNLD